MIAASSPPMTARLVGLSARLTGLYAAKEMAANPPAVALVDAAIAKFAEDLLARIAALESVSLASIPFRVEAVAHLEAQERYREHRHGEPDTTEKMLRAALNVIRDMDNAARAALTLKENEDV